MDWIQEILCIYDKFLIVLAVVKSSPRFSFRGSNLKQPMLPNSLGYITVEPSPHAGKLGCKLLTIIGAVICSSKFVFLIEL